MHLFIATKAELLKESIFFLIHLFARDILVMKKLEIEKTEPTFIIPVLKVEHYTANMYSFYLCPISTVISLYDLHLLYQF